jgi:hypothetical protein
MKLSKIKIRIYTIDWFRNDIRYRTINDVPKDKLPKYKEEAKYLGEKLKITYTHTITI